MVASVFHGIKSDYIQVVCFQDRYMDKLAKLGFVTDPELLPDELPVASIDSGRSEEKSELLEKILASIKESESKDDIEKIIKDCFGIDIDKRGSLETIKEKAIQIIKENKPAE